MQAQTIRSALILSLFLAPACDLDIPDDLTGNATAALTTTGEGNGSSTGGDNLLCDLGETAMFGPCDVAGGCGDGLACVGQPDGWFCAPSCGQCAADPGTIMCSQGIGQALGCNQADRCFVACTFAEDCLGGTTCSDGACVWAY